MSDVVNVVNANELKVYHHKNVSLSQSLTDLKGSGDSDFVQTSDASVKSKLMSIIASFEKSVVLEQNDNFLDSGGNVLYDYSIVGALCLCACSSTLTLMKDPESDDIETIKKYIFFIQGVSSDFKADYSSYNPYEIIGSFVSPGTMWHYNGTEWVEVVYANGAFYYRSDYESGGSSIVINTQSGNDGCDQGNFIHWMGLNWCDGQPNEMPGMRKRVLFIDKRKISAFPFRATPKMMFKYKNAKINPAYSVLTMLGVNYMKPSYVKQILGSDFDSAKLAKLTQFAYYGNSAEDVAWGYIDVDVYESNFTCEGTNDNENQYFTNKLTLVCKVTDYTANQVAYMLQSGNYIFLVQEVTGGWRLFGNSVYNGKVTCNLDSGKVDGDKRKLDINFEVKDWSIAPYVFDRNIQASIGQGIELTDIDSYFFVDCEADYDAANFGSSDEDVRDVIDEFLQN